MKKEVTAALEHLEIIYRKNVGVYLKLTNIHI